MIAPLSVMQPLRMRSARTLVLALLVVLSAAAVGAQNIGATLQGLITDAQKAVLPGVAVTISGSA